MEDYEDSLEEDCENCFEEDYEDSFEKDYEDSFEEAYEDFFEEDYDDSVVETPKIIQDPITETQYSRGELLGSGSFGSCYLFTDLETKRNYAGKIIMKSRLNYKLDKINEETSIQMSLRHPNILRMFGYFDCSTYVCMIMELCDDTLKGVLERLGVLDEPSCRFVVKEVACGLSHLHENRIIHRDIKPDNIFLTMDMDVKIWDFEFAIKHEDPVKKFSDSYGTITYLAPECLDGSGYSFGVDVWALGVTLYEMVVGQVPFGYTTCYELYKKIKSCDYHISSTVPTDTEDMIKSLLTRDPDSRPAIDDILKLDYLSSESISKDHLRGYILGEPSTNINNQENLNEYNAMPLSRNEIIPKGDCKLDPKNGIEDIFHKGFRLVSRCSSFEEQLSMTLQYDSSHEDENIPGKKFYLNIEKESKFILEEVDKSLGAFFCCGQGIISSSEMDSYALTRFRRPKYFITRWVDFNEKYDLGYQLSDSSVGVLFKDNSRLISDGAMKNFHYVDKNGAREYFEYDKCPTKLNEKFNLLENFKKYVGSNLSAEPPAEEQEDNEIANKGIPILLKWRRDNECICFLLFDGVLQVDFYKEHIKVIISEPTSSISIIDKDNKLRTYRTEDLAFTEMDEFMEKKITYIQKVVEEWTSLKRKHEADNYDVVPAKKCNNYK